MRNSSRSGFIMIELGLAMVLLSIIIIAALNATRSSKEQLRMQKELHFAATFDKAIKGSFLAILDEYEGRCSVITGDAATTWGWQHTSCDAASPLPVFDTTAAAGSGLDRIVYNLESASSSLLDNIIEQYAPYCVEVTPRAAGKLTLRCGGLLGLQYQLGGLNLQTVHGTVAANGTMTATGEINPAVAPTYTITYRRQRENGDVTEDVAYNGSLLDVWQKRQNVSLQKFNRFEDTLKGFHNSRLAMEVNNPAPTGLNSVDDEFIPWFWRAFGNDAAQVNGTTLCTGGTCANLNVADIWQPGNPAPALLWRRFNQNISTADTTLTVDGFGNQVRFVPIVSNCSAAAGTTNLTTCTTTATYNFAPTAPANNYFTTANVRPPHSTAIFSPSCNITTVAAPQYCRKIFSY